MFCKDGIHRSIHRFRADQLDLTFFNIANTAGFPSGFHLCILFMRCVAMKVMKVVVNRNQKQLSPVR